MTQSIMLKKFLIKLFDSLYSLPNRTECHHVHHQCNTEKLNDKYKNKNAQRNIDRLTGKRTTAEHIE